MRLEVDRLGVTSGGAVLLNDISFSLQPGERIAVVGLAGAGKSILARAVAGLLPPGMRRAGAVRLDGVPPGRGALGSKLGFLTGAAASALDPMRTVAAQIAGTPELLKETGLDFSVASRYPQQLSRAERSIVAAALVLATKQELLVADDPVSGLDILTRRRIVEMIRRHCSERSMALVLVTHDLKLAAELCPQIIVLAAGKAVEAGRTSEVLGQPRHDLTRRMVTAGRSRSRALMRAPIGGLLLDVRKVGRRHRPSAAAMTRPRAGAVALEEASFSLRAGESLALIGASGSGRSTLARIIAGLEPATSGEISFDNAVYHGSDLPAPLRREISFVFSDPAQSFNPRLTIGESITEPLRLDALKPMDELSARIVEVVNAVGLTPDTLALLPEAFSTAQLQRLALARALMTRPQLIVLDDPAATLDVVARGDLLVLLNRLRADFGLTYVLVLNDLEMVRAVADSVAVLEAGLIVEYGTPAALFEQPQHSATRQLLAAALPEIGVAAAQPA